MSAEVSLRLSDAISADDRIQLEQMLDAYNIHATGHHDARLLSVQAADESGAFLGGLQGYTWGGYCEIQTIFVSQSSRGQGVGRLLMKTAESEAILRECERIVLSTHGFQNVAFYESLGFRPVGRVDDCPTGSYYLLMAKLLIAGFKEVGASCASSALNSQREFSELR